MKQPGKASAGLLLFRRRVGRLEVLLGHPGGPFWVKKDEGAWTIPKGLVVHGESSLAAAKREFTEETGHDPQGKYLALGETRQPGGKLVQVFGVEGDWDPAELNSNMFAMEWPPKSGHIREFPELDRANWFSLDQAKRKILKGQTIFLERLEEMVRE